MVGSPAETRVRLHPARPAGRRPHLTMRSRGSPMPSVETSVETPAPRPRPRPAYAAPEPAAPSQPAQPAPPAEPPAGPPPPRPRPRPAPAPPDPPAPSQPPQPPQPAEQPGTATTSARTHPNAGLAMLMIVGGGFLTQLLTTVTGILSAR